MKIDDLMQVLELPPQYKNKFISRCQKLGFLIERDSFNEEEVQAILKQKTDYIQLEVYLQKSEKLKCLNFAPKRLENEYKLLVRKYAPQALISNSNSLMNFTPHTCCFLAEHIELMDTFADLLLSIVQDDYFISGEALSVMTPKEQAIFITNFLNEHFSLDKPQKNRKKHSAHPCLADKKIKQQDHYSVSEYAKIFRIPEDVVNKKISQGTLHHEENGIRFQDVLHAIDQELYWIGIGVLFSKGFHEFFDFNAHLDREKLRCFFEEHDYFGASIKRPDEILFEFDRKNFVYISLDDCGILYKETEMFFYDFGLTNEGLCEKLISDYRSKYSKTAAYLEAYIKKEFLNDVPWPSMVHLCKGLFRYPKELFQCTNEDILEIQEAIPTIEAKRELARFAKFLKKETTVSYSELSYAENTGTDESNSISAYSFRVFSEFAICLFNEEYIRTHHLLEKALEKSFYTEMWLYCSAHYVCGWRRKSICNKWQYLSLQENKNLFLELGFLDEGPAGIRECILSDSITQEQYEQLGAYIETKIALAQEYPEKTEKYHPETLQIKLTKSLRIHFGRLALIAEYHHLTNGEGYMRYGRADDYHNKIKLEHFFGPEIKAILGNENLKHQGLNKAFLQSVNSAGQELGYGSMVSHMIAAYARNHTNIDTISHYLSDHNLFNETPEYVIWSMFERGVMGVIPFMLLQTVFPEEFNKLSLEHQTELIKSIGVSSYELEIAYASYMPEINLRLEFLKGELAEPKEILLAMYQIGQGVGVGKDEGIYCLKRALGYSCENPVWESCIANVCPYNVFTHDGIPALFDVIEEYVVKYNKTGDEKYRQVLQQRIIPNFYDILKAVKKEMSYKDGILFDTFLREELKCRLS